MLPNPQGFVIEGGSFNEAQNQHVDHSTNYINITLSPEVPHSKAGVGYWLDSEALYKLISQVNLLAAAAKISRSLTSEGPEDPKSSSTPSVNDSTVSGAIESPTAKPVPEEPVKVIQEAKKRLTIYTGVDKALKKLKRSISIVFTLTPASMIHECGTPWAEVVWKVLQFEKTTTMRRQINWTSGTGFCRVEERDDGTLQPADLRSVVAPGTVAILETVEDHEEFFQQQMEAPYNEMRVVWNSTGSEQRLALCSIYSKIPLKEDPNQFSPVADLTVGEFFACGPPVMLQAFAVPPSEYQERQPIDTKLLRPLFVSAGSSAPEPIDISKLSKPVTAFRLYSDTSGKIVLEKDK